MKKLNQSREEVELEGKRLGICIPECHFEEKERRGRPKKRYFGRRYRFRKK